MDKYKLLKGFTLEDCKPVKLSESIDDEDCELIDEDYDPTPHCHICWSMTKAECKCPPPAENE